MGRTRPTRRDILQTGAAAAASGAVMTLAPGAIAQAGQPVPPINMLYFGNWPEIVEFFRKAAQDLRRIGLTPKLNPAPSSVVTPKIVSQRDYGDWGSIMWGATPDRLDPSFLLEELMLSTAQRNYGYYKSEAYDAACIAQRAEMDQEMRKDLVWKAQEIAAKDYPIWWLAHPVLITAHNSKDFAGAKEIMGAGYGQLYSLWNYINIEPTGARKALRAAMQNEINTLNPFSASTSPNQTFLRLIYGTLAIADADQNIRPWAAESWKVVNPRQVDVTIRKGMTWHDGKPVTPEDVAFTFEYLEKWKFPLFAGAMATIDKVTVSGDLVRFDLKEPRASFISNVLTWFFIIPKHVWQDVPEKVGVKTPGEWQNPSPIGAGPFRFGHWHKGQEVNLKAHKTHFHAPKVDEVFWRIIPSGDGAAGALARGEIDLTLDSLTPALADEVARNPNIKVAYAPSHAVYEVRPDHRKAPFNDVNFRLAVYHALDRRPIINSFNGKALIAGNTPITPLNTPWHNPSLKAPEYNVDKARDILKNAGYSWNANGDLLMKG